MVGGRGLVSMHQRWVLCVKWRRSPGFTHEMGCCRDREVVGGWFKLAVDEGRRIFEPRKQQTKSVN